MGIDADRARPLRAMDARQLGGYALLGRLGEGGMGTVYLGRAPDGRLVAIKVIKSELAEDSEFRRRFRGEVNRARQVPSFCTAEVLDADPDHDPPYLVVEYVDGPSLADVVRDRGPLTPANLHGMAIGVAAALTAIHGAGVIHRDLKPSNVLLAPGSPKVIDFGIARPVDPTTIYTETDQVVGTVAYMSPERLASNGRDISPAADIFAWGAVVAYAGTGRIPFQAESLPSVALRILNDEPDLAGLAGPLGELVRAALSKDPADRPTARELLDRLTEAGPRGATVPLGAVQAAAAAHAAPTVPRSATSGTRAVPTEVVAPKSSRRGAALAVLALAAAVITLTAAIVGVATGLIGRPDGSRTNPAAVTGTPTTPAASETTPASSPNATATGQQGPTVTPAVTQTASLIPAGTVLVAKEPLTTAGQWQPRDDTSVGGSCAMASSGLTIALTKRDVGTYRCPGPPEILGNLAVFVDVTLHNAATCAGIWFRFQDLKGYALRICPDRYELVTHGVPESYSIRVQHAMPLDERIALEKPVRVGVTAEGPTMVFYRNGIEVGRWSHSGFPQGKVILGLFSTDPSALPPYRVTFANVELYGAGL